MNRYPVEVGSVVISRCGRDEGRTFLVISEIDADFVLIANGELRTMERPKKKRRRHLKPTGEVVQAVKDSLSAGKPIEDYELRSWLKKEEEDLVQV